MSAHATSSICTACGAPLKSGALENLCPRCLFGALMSAEEEPPRVPEGERFGDYELLGVIARGGSGVVHRARHVELDRVVALKILPPELSGEEEFVERFRAEAAAGAGLEHPHIVPVYDFGAHQTRHFLAMKLVEGGPSTQRMKPHEAVARLIAVAHAVHHAHQRGVLHRDLKPGNILLDERGEPHLTDFGLARLITREATITRTRAVLGTPAYMSPEQAEGKMREVTTAADVYGLGAVLYHWLTGAPPFAGGTTLETIRQVLEAEPESPARKAPDVDRDLATVCLKCLRKEPAARYPSADALAADLERWQRGEPVAARPVSSLERALKWSRRNKSLALVTSGAALALLTASLVLWQQNTALTAARTTVTDLAEHRRRDLVKLHVETGNRLAESGDGYAALTSFAQAAALDDAPRLPIHRFRYAATLEQLPQREQTWRHGGAVFTASLSNDGTRAVTASADRTARVWNAHTGEAVTPALPHGAAVWWAGFAGGGSRVITRTKAGDIHLWDAVSGAPRGGPWQGRADMPDLHDGLARAVPLSPDSSVFAVLKPESVELRRAADGTLVREPLPCPPQPGCAAFSADGERLAVACETGGVAVFDAVTGERCAALADGLTFRAKAPPVGWRSIAWSPDGTRLSLTDRTFSARFMPADAASFSEPLLHQFMVLGTQWTPDSARLLTWSYDNTVRLWNAATEQPALPPLRHRGPVTDAALSPDGKWIASTCRDGTAQLWETATGQRRGPLLRHAGSALDVEWSRDGTRLLTTGTDGTVQLWKVSGTAAPEMECRHKGAVESIALSPDGTLAATLALEPDGALHVWRIPAGTLAARLPHPSVATSAAWLDTGTLITVTADGTLRTWDTSAAKLLKTTPVSVPRAAIASLRLSPDGRHLLIVPKENAVSLIVTTSGETVRVLGSESAMGAVWSACGNFAVTIHLTNGVWRMLLHDLNGYTSTLPGAGLLALDRDAARIAVPGSNYTVSVLDRRSGTTSPPMPHDSQVMCAAFTAGGSILATGTRDGALRFWDSTTGEPLAPPLSHASWIMAISATPDATRFLTGVNGGVLTSWHVPRCDHTPNEMLRAGSEDAR